MHAPGMAARAVAGRPGAHITLAREPGARPAVAHWRAGAKAQPAGRPAPDESRRFVRTCHACNGTCACVVLGSSSCAGSPRWRVREETRHVFRSRQMTTLDSFARRGWRPRRLVGVAPASAQILEEVTFTTSFPFTVGQKTLPAGTYTVRPAYEGDGSLLADPGARLIRRSSRARTPARRGSIRARTRWCSIAPATATCCRRSGTALTRKGADRIPVKGAETVKVEAHRAHH